jgi:hypothetical protein
MTDQHATGRPENASADVAPELFDPVSADERQRSLDGDGRDERLDRVDEANRSQRPGPADPPDAPRVADTGEATADLRPDQSLDADDGLDEAEQSDDDGKADPADPPDGREARSAETHLSGVPAGAGCTEIWEHLSDKRDD